MQRSGATKLLRSLVERSGRESVNGRLLIQEVCKRLRNIQPDGLLEAIDDLPSQKKLDELEAKSTFLHEKAQEGQQRPEGREGGAPGRRWTSSTSPSPSTTSWRPTSDIPETWSTKPSSSTPTWPNIQLQPKR